MSAIRYPASIIVAAAIVAAAAASLATPAPALAQGETRFMWVDANSVGGRRLTLATGEALTFSKNGRFRRVTPFGETQDGKWEIYLNNTVYVTQDDGRNFFFHYEKIGGDVFHFDAASRVKTKVARIVAAD